MTSIHQFIFTNPRIFFTEIWCYDYSNDDWCELWNAFRFQLWIGKLVNWWIDATNKIKDKTDTMIPSQETHQSLWVEAVEAVSFPLTKINSSYMFLLAFPLGNERVVTSKSNLPTCFYNTLLHENWNVCWVRKFLSTIAESFYYVSYVWIVNYENIKTGVSREMMLQK